MVTTRTNSINARPIPESACATRPDATAQSSVHAAKTKSIALAAPTINSNARIALNKLNAFEWNGCVMARKTVRTEATS